MKNKQQAGLTSLFHAFEMAHEEAGITPPTKPLTRRQWVDADERDGLFWQHTAFGSVKAIVRKFSVRDAGSEADASWAKIAFEGMPREISVDFKIELKKGVNLFQCRFDGNSSSIVNKVVDLTEVKPLQTPIDWIDPQSDKKSDDFETAVPSTRNKGRDDLSFILIDGAGQFIQIEVSVRTIRKALWVAVQEIYTGQVVTTNHQNARGISLTPYRDGNRVAFVAPLLPEGAYPGVDYIKTFGPDVVREALALGAFCQMSEAITAEWQDPFGDISDDMKQEGWERAVVFFFNLSWNGGSGFAGCKDGKSCFIHALQIVNEEGVAVASRHEFPFLYGREIIAVKWEQGPKGRRAIAIRKV